MTAPSYLRALAVRFGAAAALASPLACGDTESANTVSSDPAPSGAREARPEAERGGLAADGEPGAPASRLGEAAAGCTGTCQQICDCVAAACQRVGASCASLAEECRTGCERSTCRTGEPPCWGLMPGTEAPPPEDPEPEPPRPGPGPDPDPSPIDARDNASGDNTASGSSSPDGRGSY